MYIKSNFSTRVKVDFKFTEVQMEIGDYVDHTYKRQIAQHLAVFCKSIGNVPPVHIKASEKTYNQIVDMFSIHYNSIMRSE